jgi:hypothetical protein
LRTQRTWREGSSSTAWRTSVASLEGYPPSLGSSSRRSRVTTRPQPRRSEDRSSVTSGRSWSSSTGGQAETKQTGIPPRSARSVATSRASNVGTRSARYDSEWASRTTAPPPKAPGERLCVVMRLDEHQDLALAGFQDLLHERLASECGRKAEHRIPALECPAHGVAQSRREPSGRACSGRGRRHKPRGLRELPHDRGRRGSQEEGSETACEPVRSPASELHHVGRRPEGDDAEDLVRLDTWRWWRARSDHPAAHLAAVQRNPDDGADARRTIGERRRDAVVEGAVEAGDVGEDFDETGSRGRGRALDEACSRGRGQALDEAGGGDLRRGDDYRPSARRRSSTRPVVSHGNPSLERPKWPYAAVRL